MDRPLDASAASKPVSIFKTAGAYVLGVLWVAAIVYYDQLGHPQLREQMGAARWGALGAIAAIPLCVLAQGAWRNRHRFSALPWAGRLALTGRLCLATVAWTVVFFVPAFVIILPAYSPYTPRAKMSEHVLALSALRQEVSERASRSGSLAGAGRDLAAPSGRWIDYAFIGSDGLGLTYSARYGAAVFLVPRMTAGQVNWSCFVYPRRVAPGSCREYPNGERSTSLDRKIEGTAAEHARVLLDAARPLRAAKTVSRLLAPSAVADAGYQDAEGTVVLYSDRHGVLLVLEPGGMCVVHPAEAVIPGCQPGVPRDGG